MPVSLKTLGIERLGTEERLSLIAELWDSLSASAAEVAIPDSQTAELDRRLAEHRQNPNDVISWGDAKASLTERLKG